MKSIYYTVILQLFEIPKFGLFQIRESSLQECPDISSASSDMYPHRLVIYTIPKANMELNNGCFEDDIPFLVSISNCLVIWSFNLKQNIPSKKKYQKSSTSGGESQSSEACEFKEACERRATGS